MAAFLRSVPFIVASRSSEGVSTERGGFRVAPRRKVLLVEESDVVGEGGRGCQLPLAPRSEQAQKLWLHPKAQDEDPKS